MRQVAQQIEHGSIISAPVAQADDQAVLVFQRRDSGLDLLVHLTQACRVGLRLIKSAFDFFHCRLQASSLLLAIRFAGTEL